MTLSWNIDDSRKPSAAEPPIEPADRITIGQRVQGRYRIVSEIGTGSFGTVCRAEDEATGHEVAIRLLPRTLVGAFPPAGARGRKGQGIAAASTAHPALVGVLEVGEAENGRHFAAMELVTGRRLSEIIADGPLDVRLALRVAVDLGGAVETLHSSGLIHGALRPCNVMVAEDWSVKLMDVELCGSRGENAVRPHHEYLSPEEIRQWAGTEETDVYAFGALLYEMLSGVPPFRGKTREELLKKQLSAMPVPLRRRRWSAPASVGAIVAQALSKRPEQRPPMQTILNCLWQEANTPATAWNRRAVTVVAVVSAAAIPILVGWGLLAPHSRAPAPPASPAPAAVQAPVSAAPVTTAPSPDAPVPVRTAPAGATPAGTAPAPAAGKASSPAPSVSRPPRAERREQPRVPPTPADSPREQPPASNSSDDPDPGQVVDWLLERAAARRK
jgi:serine/threonine-protein kinase